MIIIRIMILCFTSVAINFIFLLIYRLAVKEIFWRDEKIKHLESLLELQGKVEGGTLDVG